jgi:hypothetical protein
VVAGITRNCGFVSVARSLNCNVFKAIFRYNGPPSNDRGVRAMNIRHPQPWARTWSFLCADPAIAGARAQLLATKGPNVDVVGRRIRGFLWVLGSSIFMVSRAPTLLRLVLFPMVGCLFICASPGIHYQPKCLLPRRLHIRFTKRLGWPTRSYCHPIPRSAWWVFCSVSWLFRGCNVLRIAIVSSLAHQTAPWVIRSDLRGMHAGLGRKVQKWYFRSSLRPVGPSIYVSRVSREPPANSTRQAAGRITSVRRSRLLVRRRRYAYSS